MKSPDIQKQLKDLGTQMKTISLRTAQWWLHAHGWRYSQKSNGMYVDGHERSDVVEYQKAFVERWQQYEKCFITYSYQKELVGGVEIEHKIIQKPMKGFSVPPQEQFQLILVTHDESTFYENDRRWLCWGHCDDKAVPQKKGEGVSLMISDFLTSEWGQLAHENEFVIFIIWSKFRFGSDCYSTGKCEFYSRLEKAGMGILQ